MIKRRNILPILLVLFSFFVANYVGYSNFSSVLYQEVPQRDALNGTQNAIANFNSNKTGILQNTTHRSQVGFAHNQQIKNQKKHLYAKPVFVSPQPVLSFSSTYLQKEIVKTCKSPIYIACRKLII